MKTKIACVQMQSALGDKAGNFIKMKEKVREITVNSSVDLIIFPELALTGYMLMLQKVFLMASISLKWLRLLRVQCIYYLRIVEIATFEGEVVLYNTAALIDREGNILGKYRKSHLVKVLKRIPLQRELNQRI